MTNNVTPASDTNARVVERSSEANMELSQTRPLYQKSASLFESKDVPLLHSLEEGWFVEFKDRLPDSAKLARSISSFANSHGGLLVIGAKEEQKTRRLSQLNPMSAGAAEQCVIRCREAVISHVTPSPFFEAKAVEIPSLDGAIEERWIVVISVPKGPRGPYLHSNGCIYVRVGDAAAPYPLADLTQQERMWEESTTRRTRTKARIEMLSEQCRQGTPSVHLFVLADDIESNIEELTFDTFREIALAPHSKSASPVFDQVQTLDTSYVARRTERLVESNSLLWEYDFLRRLHFIQLPIATYIWSGTSIGYVTEQFGLQELEDRLESRQAPENLMILHLLPTLFFISIILRKVQMLHARHKCKGELKLNARVVDAKGTIPFLGTPGYFREVEATNFPYVVRDVGFFQGLEDPTTWFSFAVEKPENDLETNMQIDIPNALGVFSKIAQSLGISPYVSFDLRNGDLSTANWEPIAGMFSEVLHSNFSFRSQTNPKASR
jgi:hypothetical protein